MTNPKSKDNVLCWLRRDLRLSDHPALSRATQMGSKVWVVFVLDPEIIDPLPRSDRRLQFILASLLELDTELGKWGSGLLVTYGDPKTEIAKLVQKLGVTTVVAAEDYEMSSKIRDLAVKKQLEPLGCSIEWVKDHVIFSGRQILNQAMGPYKVFTPYKKTWMAHLKKKDLNEFKIDFKNLTRTEPFKEYNFKSALDRADLRLSSRQDLLFMPGQSAAKKQLSKFLIQIEQYSTSRDQVDLHLDRSGTSWLSPYLRFGQISIRQVLLEALKTEWYNDGLRSSLNKGVQSWLSELIWREFYQMILDQFPHVQTQAFQPWAQNIHWPGQVQDFDAWKEGKTGYPLVDAAMRYFAKTGWMHNRLRMVVASFLVKDLLVDWRWGEKYFADHLMDFEKASNNGGWQWCASTGCDAQPFFRVFNPTLQAKRFDPEGKFIMSVLDERRGLKGKALFEPIKPIVDHKTQSKKALALFEKARF